MISEQIVDAPEEQFTERGWTQMGVDVVDGRFENDFVDLCASASGML